MNIIGVDPGLSGAVVHLCADGSIATYPMPVVGKELDFGQLASLLRIPEGSYDKHVFVERSQAFPKMGVCSAFNYGASYWGVLAICAALRIPVTKVPPMKWHRALIVGKDGSPKDRALMACRQLFPEVELTVGKGRKAHEGVVDALLIAEYGRRTLHGII